MKPPDYLMLRKGPAFQAPAGGPREEALWRGRTYADLALKEWISKAKEKTGNATAELLIAAGWTHRAQWPPCGVPSGAGDEGVEVQKSCRPAGDADAACAASGESACRVRARTPAQAATRFHGRLSMPRYTTASIPGDTLSPGPYSKIRPQRLSFRPPDRTMAAWKTLNSPSITWNP
jgi:hypothetical protein